MNILAIDPGHRQSAIVGFNGVSIFGHDILENELILVELEARKNDSGGSMWPNKIDVLVCERMQVFKSAFGIGQEVFESVHWSGRFEQVWTPRKFDRLYRSQVRAGLGASKGGDASIRAALIERFGPFKETAIGKRSSPGPLFGITSHEWSALAIAVVYHDLHGHEDPARAVRPGVAAEF